MKDATRLTSPSGEEPATKQDIYDEIQNLRAGIEENRETLKIMAARQSAILELVSNAKFGLRVLAWVGAFVLGTIGILNVLVEWVFSGGK